LADLGEFCTVRVMVIGSGPFVASAGHIRLSDLDLAAALLALGRARLIGHVSSGEAGRQEFVLEGVREQVAATTTRYALGDLLVEPRAFAAARRLLQRQLRDQPPLSL
jgi:hypothetical protein